MGFLGRIIKPLVENAFDRMQSEAMQIRLKEQDKSLAKIQSLFPIQELFNFGPMSAASTWRDIGRRKVRQEIEFGINKLFEPFIADFNAFQGTMETLFGPFWYETRVGRAVGETIGGGIGYVAGFFLPGGPLLWQPIFGWLGGLLGTLVTGWGDVNHPDIPGSPGEITTPSDDPYAYIPHDLPDIVTPDRVQTATSPVTPEWRLMQTFRVNHYI